MNVRLRLIAAFSLLAQSSIAEEPGQAPVRPRPIGGDPVIFRDGTLPVVPLADYAQTTKRPGMFVREKLTITNLSKDELTFLIRARTDKAWTLAAVPKDGSADLDADFVWIVVPLSKASMGDIHLGNLWPEPGSSNSLLVREPDTSVATAQFVMQRLRYGRAYILCGYGRGAETVARIKGSECREL